MRYNIHLAGIVRSVAQMSKKVAIGLFSIIFEVGRGRD